MGLARHCSCKTPSTAHDERAPADEQMVRALRTCRATAVFARVTAWTPSMPAIRCRRGRRVASVPMTCCSRSATRMPRIARSSRFKELEMWPSGSSSRVAARAGGGEGRRGSRGVRGWRDEEPGVDCAAAQRAVPGCRVGRLRQRRSLRSGGGSLARANPNLSRDGR